MTKWTVYTDDTPMGILTAKMLEHVANTKIFNSGMPLEQVLSGSYQNVIVVGNFEVSQNTIKLEDSLPPHLYLATYPNELLKNGSYSQEETNWLRLYKLCKANGLMTETSNGLYEGYDKFVLLPDESYESVYNKYKKLEPLLIMGKLSKYGSTNISDAIVKVLEEEKKNYIDRKLAKKYQFTKGNLQVSVVKADLYMHEIALKCQVDSTKLGYKNAVFVQNGSFVVVHKSPDVDILDELGIDNLEQVGNTYSFFMDNLEDNTLAEALRSTLNEA